MSNSDEIIYMLQQQEAELLEFKENYHNPDELGKDISAMANTASYRNQEAGYILFGVRDDGMATGSSFDLDAIRIGNEVLRFWLTNMLSPFVDIQQIDVPYQGMRILGIKVPGNLSRPVQFKGIPYIRNGAQTRKLAEFESIERKIWKGTHALPIELNPATSVLNPSEIEGLLDISAFFNLARQPAPTSLDLSLAKMAERDFLIRSADATGYQVTLLGAILFARDLNSFGELYRKSVRIIRYTDRHKLYADYDSFIPSGYALAIDKVMQELGRLLPQREEIRTAQREIIYEYPQAAIRELLINMLSHQDLNENDYPRIEIFTDRIEFTNSGTPLLDFNRFIDGDRPRNPRLVDALFLMHFSEQRGSGIDRVFAILEKEGLPPLKNFPQPLHTRIILFRHHNLEALSKTDRLLVCYQHACLRFIMHEPMTNASLRDRFRAKVTNSASISRLIKECVEAGLIKRVSEESSKKYSKYVPYWA